jgi:cytoskeletal protein CcmA (bactofilin family)
MFGRESRSNARIDTLVGKSAKVAGDVEFTGGLHLDGRVAGNVRVGAEIKGKLVPLPTGAPATTEG